MKISVIIPAYNESAVIEKNISELKSFMGENFDDFEIVVVSDGSTDNTHSIIKNKLVCESVVDASYNDNRGKGGALKVGVSVCSGDIVLTTDCDLAYGLEVIKEAVDKMVNNPDINILIGSRSISKDGFALYPPLRKIASKIYFKMLSFYATLKVSDSQCGFKCYRKDTAKKLFENLQTTGFAFDLEILLYAKKLGIKIYELPVSIKVHGQSKISIIRDSVKMIRDVKKIKKHCTAQNGGIND